MPPETPRVVSCQVPVTFPPSATALNLISKRALALAHTRVCDKLAPPSDTSPRARQPIASDLPSVVTTWPEPRQSPAYLANGPSWRAPLACGPTSNAPASAADRDSALTRVRDGVPMLEI